MIRERIDAVVCDLDGVVYRGAEPIAGSVEALRDLRLAGIKVVFCTNNSRSTVDEYVEKLTRMGVETGAEDVVTSAIVTAEVLEERGFSGKTAIVVGGDGVRGALSDVCISIKDDPSVTRSDLVVVGWDPEFDYAAMARAATAVIYGATFIATNTDATYPGPNGLLPGAGAIAASIATACGRAPESMGKPHPPMFDVVSRRLEGAERIVVVGDRVDTDLAGARTRGWTGVLVLSGVTKGSDVAALDPPPDRVEADLRSFVSAVVG